MKHDVSEKLKKLVEQYLGYNREWIREKIEYSTTENTIITTDCNV